MRFITIPVTDTAEAERGFAAATKGDRLPVPHTSSFLSGYARGIAEHIRNTPNMLKPEEWIEAIEERAISS